MRIINWLLDNYNTNADAHWLVDYHDIWVMPDSQPRRPPHRRGGRRRQQPLLPAQERRQCRTAAGCSWPPTPYDQFGVDNNRNFPFKWNCCGGSSGYRVRPDLSRLSAAESEPENQAIVNKSPHPHPRPARPGDTDPAPITTTGVYQNMHTIVSSNLFTWGWTATQHAQLC